MPLEIPNVHNASLRKHREYEVIWRKRKAVLENRKQKGSWKPIVQFSVKTTLLLGFHVSGYCPWLGIEKQHSISNTVFNPILNWNVSNHRMSWIWQKELLWVAAQEHEGRYLCWWIDFSRYFPNPSPENGKKIRTQLRVLSFNTIRLRKSRTKVIQTGKHWPYHLKA
jgi:hypothetical protein